MGIDRRRLLADTHLQELVLVCGESANRAGERQQQPSDPSTKLVDLVACPA